MGSQTQLEVAALGACLVLGACATIAGLEDGSPVPPGSLTNAGGPQKAGAIVVSPLEMKFPDVLCGASAEQLITIRNEGDTATPYEAVIASGSAFAIRGTDNVIAPTTKGVAPPHGEVKIALVLAAFTQPGTFGADIFVSTPESAEQVRAEVNVTGASLSMTPSLVDFGDVRKDTTTPEQLVDLENTGNQPVTIGSFVRSGGNPDFAVDATNLVLAPGDKRQVATRFLPGPAGSPTSADFTAAPVGTICGELPKLTLKGTRVNQDLLINPLTVDFGEVSCNATSSPTRSVVISNYGDSPAPYTISFSGQNASWFAADPAGTVPAATGPTSPGTATITVRRTSVTGGLGRHPESATIAVAGPAGITRVASVEVTIVGAIIDVSPTSLSSVSGSGKTFSVRNTGNKYITLNHSSSSDDFSVTTTSTLNPRETENPKVWLTTNKQGTHTTTVTTTRANFPGNAPLCGSPSVVKVSGSK